MSQNLGLSVYYYITVTNTVTNVTRYICSLLFSSLPFNSILFNYISITLFLTYYNMFDLYY